MQKNHLIHIKDFSGYIVASGSACCRQYNNKVVERTIRKAFPTDRTSTLYIVKVKGVRDHLALYEDEMIKVN
jgi:hypothetical protein